MQQREPKLHSLAVEEALVASLLLHEELHALEEFTDEEVWFDHIRPIISTVRMLRGANKPCGTVFVLAVLASKGELDAIEYAGESGEVLVIDILQRHVLDVQAFYGRQLGRLVHHYAEKRKALQRAQEAAQKAATQAYLAELNRYEGELV